MPRLKSFAQRMRVIAVRHCRCDRACGTSWHRSSRTAELLFREESKGAIVMKWLGSYVRRRMKEAIWAGIHDALTCSDREQLTDEQAAQALRDFMAGGSAASESSEGPGPDSVSGSNGDNADAQAGGS